VAHESPPQANAAADEFRISGIRISELFGACYVGGEMSRTGNAIPCAVLVCLNR